MNEENSLDVNELMKNSVTYLHKLCQLEALNNPTLKTYYSTKCRLMELKANVFLPKNLTKSSVKCQRCLTNFHDGPADYKLQKNKNSKFCNKLLKQKIQGKQKFTKYQRKYLKHIKNKEDNSLVISCKFCKKKTEFHLTKVKELPPTPVQQQVKSSKKKRKKDKSCGLKLILTDKNQPFKTQDFIPLNQSRMDKKCSKIENNNDVSIDLTDTVNSANAMDEIISKTLNINKNYKPRTENENETRVYDKIKVKNTDNNKIVHSKPKVALTPIQLARNKKSLSRLANMLKSSTPIKNTPSSKLKKFLEGL